MKDALEEVKTWLFEELFAAGPRMDLDMVLVSVRDNPQEVLDWAESQMDNWVDAVDRGNCTKIEDKKLAAQAILDGMKVRFAKELAELGNPILVQPK